MPAVLLRQEVFNEYARTLIRVKASQLIRRPGFSRSDLDDLQQDLFLHLLSQAQHFDPARGSINTFIARVVDSAVAMLLRAQSRRKRSPADGIELQSLETIVELRGAPPSPLSAAISSTDLDRRTGVHKPSDLALQEMAESVEHAINSLPSDLGDLCRMLMMLNCTDAARDLGLSRRKFTAAKIAIRQHFERAGLDKD